MSLTDAILVTTEAMLPVVSFRFENDQIAGEYSPESGVSPQQYLGDFLARYGTQPEVVGYSLAATEGARRSRAVSVASVPEYRAPSMPASVIEELSVRMGIPVAKRGDLNGESNALAAGDWRPNMTQTRIEDYGSTIYFEYSLLWDSPTSPIYVPGDFGFEVGTELYNNAGTNIRPYCGASYKDAFFAKNYGWNWAVIGEQGDYLAASSPYADYNDLTDPCNRNSISIGFRYPQNIPLAYYNQPYDWVVFVMIEAPQGNQSSNRISAGIDLVSDAWCDAYPSYALTDCMGVSTAGDTEGAEMSRGMLAEWRNWTAPNRCWTSSEKGQVDPVLTFPTASGC